MNKSCYWDKEIQSELEDFEVWASHYGHGVVTIELVTCNGDVSLYFSPVRHVSVMSNNGIQKASMSFSSTHSSPPWLSLRYVNTNLSI